MTFDDDEEERVDPVLVIGRPAPRRWSWWLVGSMATQMVGEQIELGGRLLREVAIAMVAHAEHQQDRAEMHEQGAREIEMLTTGGGKSG